MPINYGEPYQKNYCENLNYKDILLTPRYSELGSRSEADTTVTLGNFKFDLPVFPANMRTVIDEDLAVWLSERNLPYVMHRFNVDSYKFNRKMHQRNLMSSISLGVNEDSYETIDLIAGNGSAHPHFITIDIAHGHCAKMKKMLAYVKEKLPESFVIAGNVATPEATTALEEWGADAVKVGIGPGCFIAGTKVMTNKGEVNIEDINVGDEVYTHKNRLKKVIGTKKRIEEDRLVTINDNLKSTPQHEYYVVHKKYKNVVNENNIDEYAEWIEAEKLTKEYLLIQYK